MYANDCKQTITYNNNTYRAQSFTAATMAPFYRPGTRWRAAYGPHSPAAKDGSLSPPCPAVATPATLDLLKICRNM